MLRIELGAAGWKQVCYIPAMTGLRLTGGKVEADVDEAEDDEGEGHGDWGGHADHEPAVVALPDALQGPDNN